VKRLVAFWYDDDNNWGDVFTPFVFAQMGVELEWANDDRIQLFATGSVLDRISRHYTQHIFGSGLLYADRRPDLRNAQVHALRGKRTLERCRLAGSPVLGDPGLLASDYVRKPAQPEIEYGIIPHYVDRDHEEVKKWSHRDDTLVIDIRAGIRNVLNQAATCRNLVSSSLHGLVIADSLGIPNQWVRLSEKVLGGEFKFVDYYSVFDEFPSPAASIDEAFQRVATRDTERVKADLKAAIARFVSEIPE
jgi:pyruvyltransferase